MFKKIKNLRKRLITKAVHLHKQERFTADFKERDSRITALAKDMNILSEEQKRELTAFWSRYDKHYNVANHVFFKEARGEYNINYVPNGFHYTVIDRFYNDWEMALYMDNKCLYSKIFNVRMAESICYRMNGFWCDAAYTPITEEQAIELIAAQPESFLKIARDSYCGKGVQYISPDIAADKAQIADIISGMGEADLVAQKALHQSAVTAAFAPASVNSMRVYTLLRRDGSVKVYSIILRMGMGKAKVDNAHSGGICVGVDLQGKLNDLAYSVSGEHFEQHPTSHIRFSDITLPNMDAVLAMVEKAAHCVPYFRLVGWDVALDENNEPVLLEANMAHPGVEVLQLCNGPLFGNDLPDILAEVCGKH